MDDTVRTIEASEIDSWAQCMGVGFLYTVAEGFPEYLLGDVDLAAGYFPDIIKANFYQQHLFAHTFACLVREGHPTIRKRMTMKQFMDATHIVIRAEGRSQEIFERHLEEKRITRNTSSAPGSSSRKANTADVSRTELFTLRLGAASVPSLFQTENRLGERLIRGSGEHRPESFHYAVGGRRIV